VNGNVKRLVYLSYVKNIDDDDDVGLAVTDFSGLSTYGLTA